MRVAHERRPAVLAGLLLLSFPLTLAGCIDDDRWDEAPVRLAVYGDSFTRGAAERPEVDWVVGVDPQFRSVLTRMRSVHEDAAAWNGAEDGARWRDLASRVESGRRDAQFVVVFLGLNDVCMGGFQESSFLWHVREGLERIREAHPGAVVTVLAVPEVTSYRALHAQVPQSRDLWSNTDYCRDALAPDASQRSIERARSRVASANRILESESDRQGFLFGEATLWPGFGLQDLSPHDYFHPNVRGEGRLAESVWSELAPLVHASR